MKIDLNKKEKNDIKAKSFSFFQGLTLKEDLKQTFYYLSWLAIILAGLAVFLGLILKLNSPGINALKGLIYPYFLGLEGVLGPVIRYLKEADVFLFVFIFINLILLNRVLSPKGLKKERFWLWLLICLLIFNFGWSVGMSQYGSLGIYNFNISLNYFIILLGFLELNRIRVWLKNLFIKIWQASRDSFLGEGGKDAQEDGLKGRYAYKILLIIIILSGFFLRLWNLGYLSLTTDEVYNGIATKEILEKGAPVMPDDSYYLRGLTLSYLSSFFALFFGTNEFSVRLPSALAGIGIIICFYLIGRELINKKFALGLSLIAALFPWFIEFSRWGRFYNLITFLVLLNFYLSLKAFKTHRLVYLIFSIFTALLSVITIEWGYFTILVMFLVFIYYSSREIKKYLFSFKKIIIIFSGLFFLFFANLAVNTIVRGGYSWTIGQSLSRYLRLFKDFSYDGYFISFLFNNFFFLFLGLIFSIIWLLFSKKNSKDAVMLIIVTLLQIFFISVYHNFLNPRALFFAMPLIIICASFGYYVFFLKLTERIKSVIFLKNYLALITTILFFVFFVDIIYAFEIPFREYGDRYKNPNFAPTTVTDYLADTKSAPLYVKERLNQGDIVIIDHFLFYYYYTGEEPDYYLRPGSLYLVNLDAEDHTLEGKVISYMSKTRLINEKREFFELLANTSSDVYLILNLEFGHSNINRNIATWLNQASERHSINKIFTGLEEHAVVYLIQNRL